MTDVLFKCWKCSKNLAVSTRRIGQTYPCPSCEQPLMVPDSTIFYNCHSCNWGLCSPANHQGERLSCPNCATILVVPADNSAEMNSRDSVKIRCIRCHQGMVFDMDHYQELVGRTVDCLTCSRKIPIPTGNLKPDAEVVL